MLSLSDPWQMPVWDPFFENFEFVDSSNGHKIFKMHAKIKTKLLAVENCIAVKMATLEFSYDASVGNKKLFSKKFFFEKQVFALINVLVFFVFF